MVFHSLSQYFVFMYRPFVPVNYLDKNGLWPQLVLAEAEFLVVFVCLSDSCYSFAIHLTKIVNDVK